MSFLRDENATPYFEKGTALLLLNHPLPCYTLFKRSTYKESNGIRKFIHDLPGQNGGLLKFIRCLTLTECHFG